MVQPLYDTRDLWTLLRPEWWETISHVSGSVPVWTFFALTIRTHIVFFYYFYFEFFIFIFLWSERIFIPSSTVFASSVLTARAGEGGGHIYRCIQSTLNEIYRIIWVSWEEHPSAAHRLIFQSSTHVGNYSERAHFDMTNRFEHSMTNSNLIFSISFCNPSSKDGGIGCCDPVIQRSRPTTAPIWTNWPWITCTLPTAASTSVQPPTKPATSTGKPASMSSQVRRNYNSNLLPTVCSRNFFASLKGDQTLLIVAHNTIR